MSILSQKVIQANLLNWYYIKLCKTLETCNLSIKKLTFAIFQIYLLIIIDASIVLTDFGF